MNIDDLAFIVIAVVWLIGFIRELAMTHARLETSGTKIPSRGVGFAMAVLMFFTWPYWFFYK